MNTRVAVPLSQEAYDAVTLLAEVGRVSRGRFLADILEAAVPSFLAVAAAYRAAMAVEGEERAQLVAGMAEAEKRLLAALAEAIPEGGLSAAAPPHREGSAGAERPSDPPILTGGFTTSPDEDRRH
jgi:hypothetical protein